MNAVVKGDIAQGFSRNITSKNDEGSLSIELLPQSLRDLNAVHTVWQVVVGKDKIRSRHPARHRFQSSRTVDGGRNGIALFVEKQLQMLSNFRVVFNDQDRSSAPRRFRGCVVGQTRTIARRGRSADRSQRDLDREN